MNKLRYLTILFTIAIAVSSAPFAQAISFDFTVDHVTGGAGPAPYGTVTLTQTAGNVDFNVTLTAGYKFVKTGSADFQYFKFNGTGVAVGDIININQNFAGFTLSAATGAFNGDGTGNFTFGITSNHGNGGSPPATLALSRSVLPTRQLPISPSRIISASSSLLTSSLRTETPGRWGPFSLSRTEE